MLHALLARWMLEDTPMWAIMREEEERHGHVVVLPGTVDWLPASDWDDTCVVSMDRREVRLVAILARTQGQGAFRRLVAAIEAHGLRPVIVDPFEQMKAILLRWGWHLRAVGHSFETREMQWRPPHKAKGRKRS